MCHILDLRESKKELTGRRERQQKRRIAAGELFEQDRTRAEVAAILKVTWKTAHEWFKEWNRGGKEALAATKGNPGPAPKFSAQEMDILRAELLKGSVAHGYRNEIWTLRRVGQLVWDLFAKRVSVSEVWRLLKAMEWSPQKPRRQARERDEQKIDQWKKETWPQLCEKARTEGRTIIFVDECGFSQKSTAKKTWAPVAQTPVIEMNFNWDKLSVIGGISLKSVYFQIHEESIKSEQVVGFLDHLQRYVSGAILVIWDGLPAHR
jgi:transposase